MKIKLYVSTGFAGCKHTDTEEIDDEYWNSLSEKERDNLLDQMATDYLSNCIDYGAYVEDEDESN